MSEVTLEAIENLLESKLEEKLEEKLEPIRAVQRAHTTMLEQLMTEKKTKEDNNTVTEYRFERLEKWGEKVGSSVGIKLEL